MGASVTLIADRDRRFVDAYMGAAHGSATEAIIYAGLANDVETARVLGATFLARPEIQSAIHDRTTIDPLIATALERKRFWTEIMRDRNEDIRARMRASELLAKAQGDFVQRVQAEVVHEVAAPKEVLQQTLDAIRRRLEVARATMTGDGNVDTRQAAAS